MNKNPTLPGHAPVYSLHNPTFHIHKTHKPLYPVSPRAPEGDELHGPGGGLDVLPLESPGERKLEDTSKTSKEAPN